MNSSRSIDELIIIFLSLPLRAKGISYFKNISRAKIIKKVIDLKLGSANFLKMIGVKTV